MDKKQNNNQKFYKNQNFYVALIVAICLVTATAVIAIRNRGEAQATNTNVENNIINNVEGENNTLDIYDSEENEESFVDSEEVEAINEEKGLSIVVTDETIEDAENTVATNTTILEKLQNPVEGAKIYPFRNGNTGVIDPTDNINKTPRGIGIKCEVGTEVKASADGLVEYVGYDKEHKYGNLVVLKHGDGLKTVYANLEESKVVKVGQEVKVGEVIGKVGKTATYFVKEPRLHFEVLITDKDYETVMANYNENYESFVDPSKYLNLN